MKHETLLTNGAEVFISGDPKLTKKRIANEGFYEVENKIVAVSLGSGNHNHDMGDSTGSINVLARLESGETIETYLALERLDVFYSSVVINEMFIDDNVTFFTIKPLHLEFLRNGQLQLISRSRFKMIVAKESKITELTAKDLEVGREYFIPDYDTKAIYLGKIYGKYEDGNHNDKVGMTHLFFDEDHENFKQYSASRIKKEIQLKNNLKFDKKSALHVIDLLKGTPEALIEFIMGDTKVEYVRLSDARNVLKLHGFPRNKAEYESQDSITLKPTIWSIIDNTPRGVLAHTIINDNLVITKEGNV